MSRIGKRSPLHISLFVFAHAHVCCCCTMPYLVMGTLICQDHIATMGFRLYRAERRIRLPLDVDCKLSMGTCSVDLCVVCMRVCLNRKPSWVNVKNEGNRFPSEMSWRITYVAVAIRFPELICVLANPVRKYVTCMDKLQQVRSSSCNARVDMIQHKGLQHMHVWRAHSRIAALSILAPSLLSYCRGDDRTSQSLCPNIRLLDRSI